MSESDSDDSTYSDHSLELDPDLEIEIVAHSLIKFSTELYLALKMRLNHSNNLVWAPVFASNMMAGLKYITEGGTGADILKHVFPDLSGADNIGKNNLILRIGFQAILEAMKEDVSKSFSLKASTCIFLQSRLLPKVDVIKEFETFFKIHLEEFDFVEEEWRTFSEFVKEWALKSSARKIGAVFNGPLGIDIDTHKFRMILINLVYFKGNWVYPFHPINTANLPFYTDEKQSVEVPMMKSELLKNVLFVPMRKLDCQAVALPYKGERLCLVLFIPNERSGLPKIELRLETLSPKEYIREMYLVRSKMSQDTSVRVSMPRFTIDSTIDLSIPLQELGIDTLFQKGRHEFSHFTENVSEVFVNQIWQKVIFEVNETGTRKANSKFTSKGAESRLQENSQVQESAITNPASSLSSEGSSDKDIIEIIADHPFYFQVVDIKLDVILLSGCCKNPLVRDSNQEHLQNLVRNSRRRTETEPFLSGEVISARKTETDTATLSLSTENSSSRCKSNAKKNLCDIEFDCD